MEMEDGPPEGGLRVDCAGIRERFSVRRAERAQRVLARKVEVADRLGPVRRVLGLDVSYVRGEGDLGIGVAVLLSYPHLDVVSCHAYVGPVCVPYIPGLLAFREMAVLGPLLTRVAGSADLIMVDGHGIAHPRRLGIASHVGVVTDTPSIGVAKKRLYGRVGLVRGRRVLLDEEGRVIAVILSSGRGSEIFVSPGHRVSPFTAAGIVERMLVRGHRLPEPTRVADMVTKRLKKLAARGSLGRGHIQCYGSSFHSISSL